MDTSALYSDIVLPTATWYEKDDLNTTDMHSFIHPLSAAVPPSWESKSDWDIFKILAEKVSALGADAPAQTGARPGCSAPAARHSRRNGPGNHPGLGARGMRTRSRCDDAQLCGHRKGLCQPGQSALSLLDLLPGKKASAIHGIRWSIDDLYQQLLDSRPTVTWGGRSAIHRWRLRAMPPTSSCIWLLKPTAKCHTGLTKRKKNAWA